MKSLIIASMLVLFPLLCRADNGQRVQFLSGNDLLSMCEGEISKRLICEGYIIAVSDVLTANKINGFEVCGPIGPDVNSGQLIDIVRLYLKNNPSERDTMADGLVAAALRDAFPC